MPEKTPLEERIDDLYRPVRRDRNSTIFFPAGKVPRVAPVEGFQFRAPEMPPTVARPAPAPKFEQNPYIGANPLEEAAYADSIYKARIPEFLYNPPFGIPLFKNIPEIRRLAKTPFVSMVRNTIVNEVSELTREAIPRKDATVPDDVLEQTNDFFLNPNANDESFSTLLKRWVTDIVEIDAGVCNKIFSLKEDLKELHVYDGAGFTKNPNEYGILPAENAYYQYGWTTGVQPIALNRKEIVYTSLYPRTDSVYGFSPVEACFDVLYVLQYGIENNKDYFTSNSIIKGAMTIPGASKDDVKQIREQIRFFTRKRDYGGNWTRVNYELPVFNYDAKFQPLQFSNVELELITQQQWFTKLLFGCYGVTPSEIGFTEDSNRAVDLSQQAIFKRKVLLPYINLLEYHISTQIINDLPWIKGKYENKVWFDFNKEDLGMEMNKRAVVWGDWERGITTLNQTLEKLEMEPVQNGDVRKNEGQGANGSVLSQTTGEAFGEGETEAAQNNLQADKGEHANPSDNPFAISFDNPVEQKAKIYLRPGEKAPKGVSVQKGERGGEFYESTGKEASEEKKNDSEPTAPDSSEWKERLMASGLVEETEKGQPVKKTLEGNTTAERLKNFYKQPETKQWVDEMSSWHEKTDKNVPVFVFGRHAWEKNTLKETLEDLKEIGAKVFEIPVEFQRFTSEGPSDQGAFDRRNYDKFLSELFKGRPVVDVHTAPGFSGISPYKWFDNEWGVEMPANGLGMAAQQYFQQLIGKGLKPWKMQNQRDITELKSFEEQLMRGTRMEEVKAETTGTSLVLGPFERISPARFEKEFKKYLAELENESTSKIEVKAIDLGKIWTLLQNMVHSAFNDGLEKAGEETNQNFVPDQRIIQALANYSLQRVKDLDEETKIKLRRELQTSAIQGEPRSKMVERIQDVFGASKSRAEMIAQTESVRAETLGKLQGYNEAGRKGLVVWKAQPGAEVHCKNLDGKKVPLGQLFREDKWAVVGPPLHPNCRCEIGFIEN